MTCEITVDHKIPITSSIDIFDWSSKSAYFQSFHIGKSQGFQWGMSVHGLSLEKDSVTIFPLTIWKNAEPISYPKRLLNGMMISAIINTISRKFSSSSSEGQSILNLNHYSKT